MYFFREHTIGRILVMGRKTYGGMGNLSFPYRHITALTTQSSFRTEGNAKVMHSIDELLAYSQTILEGIYVSGGNRIFQGLLLYTGRIWRALTDNTFKGDTYTGDIDSSDFALIEGYGGTTNQENLYAHRFQKWERVRDKVVLKEEQYPGI